MSDYQTTPQSSKRKEVNFKKIKIEKTTNTETLPSRYAFEDALKLGIFISPVVQFQLFEPSLGKLQQYISDIELILMSALPSSLPTISPRFSLQKRIMV